MKAVLGAVLLLAATMAWSSAWSSAAHAQSDATTIPAARDHTSSERFIIELGGGPFSPNFEENEAFDEFFGGDSGPLLAMQLSYIVFRLPEIAYVTVGGGFGWVNYTANAIATFTDAPVSEETSLTLLPITTIASVRLDILPRKFHFPIIFAGKLGFQWTHWDTETGANNDAAGWAVGFVYGGQIALDLDSFDSAAARSMDEEWGINHSYLFFEVTDFVPTQDSLPVGGFAWSLGLGFNF